MALNAIPAVAKISQSPSSFDGRQAAGWEGSESRRVIGSRTRAGKGWLRLETWILILQLVRVQTRFVGEVHGYQHRESVLWK